MPQELPALQPHGSCTLMVVSWDCTISQWVWILAMTIHSTSIINLREYWKSLTMTKVHESPSPSSWMLRDLFRVTLICLCNLIFIIHTVLIIHAYNSGHIYCVSHIWTLYHVRLYVKIIGSRTKICIITLVHYNSWICWNHIFPNEIFDRASSWMCDLAFIQYSFSRLLVTSMPCRNCTFPHTHFLYELCLGHGTKTK